MNTGLGALRFFNRVISDRRNGGFQAGIQGVRSCCLPLKNQSGNKCVRFKFGRIAGVAELSVSAVAVRAVSKVIAFHPLKHRRRQFLLVFGGA